MVSNSPEQMAGSEPVLVLCRVRLPEWRARLFFHHQNIGGPLRIAPFFLNHGTAPLELYVARASGDSAERPGGAVDGDPAVAGLNTLRSYFESRSDGGEVDHYLATVAPGSRVLIAARDVPRGHTASGMFDFALRPVSGRGGVGALAVEMGVVAWRGTTLPTREQLLGAPAKADDPRQARTRGVYRYGGRRGKIGFVVPEDGLPRWLDLAGPESGVYSRPLPGEFPRDIVRGNGRLDTNPGNYGVVYDLSVTLGNPRAWGTRVVCLLNLAGGAGGSVVAVDGACLPPRGVLRKAFGSYVWHEARLAPGGSGAVRLRFSLPGGASGAHRLYFWCRPL